MLARLRRVPFAAQVLLALVVGVALGFVAREMGTVADGSPNWLTSTLQTIGSTFVTLLKTLVPPLIVTAVIVSIANLKQVSNAARLAAQTLLWFAITALIAVGIGITLGLFTQPGRNSSVDAAAQADPTRTGSWFDFLNGIVPGNILGLQSSAEGDLSFNVLQLIVIAAAIGTVGLIGNAVASYGWESLGSLGVFAVLRLVRRSAGRDDEDGRLRGDLPRAGGDLRRPVLRGGPRPHRLPAHRPGVCDRLGHHRAGVTGAVVMLTLTLSTLGLPLAVDPILDMGRTAVNVAGQALVPTIVAKREGILDLERYRSTKTIDPLAPVEDRGGVDADLRERVTA